MEVNSGSVRDLAGMNTMLLSHFMEMISLWNDKVLEKSSFIVDLDRLVSSTVKNELLGHFWMSIYFVSILLSSLKLLILPKRLLMRMLSMSGLVLQFTVSQNSEHGKMRKISTFDGNKNFQSISVKKILDVPKVISTVKAT